MNAMDALARLNGTLVGRYHLEREIGRGGMATVYLARDLRHQRFVAFKLLDPELGAVIGVERFLAEIRVTANLQHPNLLPLFDSGEAGSPRDGAGGGLLYYVMPFIDGESLRARLEREKQLPVDEAVRIACGVASALDYAHRNGVVHRDLKPENILLQDGQPIVTDFGIALAVSKAGGARITQTGLSLGTPQYMSPEQAAGDRNIDGRTDIYSLGAVLYEMLVGDPPHVASTAQAVIAKVLTEKPPSVRVARPAVPNHVAHAVERALEKLPADRWPTARELSAALEDKGAAAPQAVAPTSRSRGIGTVVPWIAFAAAAAAAVWGWARRPAPNDTPVGRFNLALPGEPRPTPDPTTLAVAPDGGTIAFVSVAAGTRQLFLRRLDDMTTRAVPGIVNAYDVAFSPNGKSLALVSDARLRTVRLADGAVTPLSDVGDSYGIAWSDDGSIIFTKPERGRAGATALWRIPEAGGEPRVLCPVDAAAGERSQWSPYAITGRDVVLYTSVGPGGITNLRLAVCDTRTGATRLLGVAGVQVVGLLQGQLIFVRADGKLMGVPFDAGAANVQGVPTQLVDSLRVEVTKAPVALSSNGTLAYMSGSALSQPVLVDAASAPRPITEERRVFWHPRFSPDGRHIAFDVAGPQSTDIWLYDVASRTFTRATTKGYNDRPEWSRDGKRVVFLSDQAQGGYGIWWQPVDGSAPAEKVFSGPNTIREVVATPDGKSLVFREDHPDRRRDLYLLPLDAKRTPVPLVVTDADELMPRISPDGRWLAYQSDESGQAEVYVRPFTGVGGRVQVSAGGGREPLWSRDGTRVLYRQGRQVIGAVLDTTSGPTPSITSRSVVVEGDFLSHPFHQNYDIAPDGRSLLMLAPVADDSRFMVVLNWDREVRAKTR